MTFICVTNVPVSFCYVDVCVETNFTKSWLIVDIEFVYLVNFIFTDVEVMLLTNYCIEGRIQN